MSSIFCLSYSFHMCVLEQWSEHVKILCKCKVQGREVEVSPTVLSQCSLASMPIVLLALSFRSAVTYPVIRNPDAGLTGASGAVGLDFVSETLPCTQDSGGSPASYSCLLLCLSCQLILCLEC